MKRFRRSPGSAPIILCTLPGTSHEAGIIRDAVETMNGAAHLVFSASTAGEAVTGAVVVGELSGLAGLSGGGVEPAALVAILPAGHPTGIATAMLEDPAVVWSLSRPLDLVKVRAGLRHALRWVRLTGEARRSRSHLASRDAELAALSRIGLSLAAESSPADLLNLILTRAREVVSAEAGGLFLIEEDAWGTRGLVSRAQQNDSLAITFQEARMGLVRQTIPGYVALTGQTLNIEDVYDLPPSTEYSFSAAWDRQIGYRTRSLLALPLVSHRGEILGVVQLANRREPECPEEEAPQPFDEHHVELARVLAMQAAAAIESLRRQSEGWGLFEGMVQATVESVELRDPTTSGHAQRVALMSEALADAVDHAGSGPHARTRVSRDEMAQLRYAALLHDIGKLQVPESTLLKARKLHPHQLRVIEDRFRLHRMARELAAARGAPAGAGDARQLDQMLQLIRRASDPGPLDERQIGQIEAIQALGVEDGEGGASFALSSDEAACLKIDLGTLTPAERRDVESHAAGSHRFLSTLPWPAPLRKVPEIVWAHHERMDGTGYPRGLKAAEIPLLSRILALCDVFDALTARDRPFRRAVGMERALGVLEEEARANRLDRELLRLFILAKVHEKVVARARQAGQSGTAAH